MCMTVHTQPCARSSPEAELVLQLLTFCPLPGLLAQHMNRCHGRVCDGLVAGTGTSEDLKEGHFGEG